MSGRSGELQKLLRQLQAEGVSVRPTKSGHYCIDLHDGIEVVGGSPGNATLNKLHRLIRKARAIGRAAP